MVISQDGDGQGEVGTASICRGPEGDSDGSVSRWVIIGHSEPSNFSQGPGIPISPPCPAPSASLGSGLHSGTPPARPCLQRGGCQGEAPRVSHPSAISARVAARHGSGIPVPLTHLPPLTCSALLRGCWGALWVQTGKGPLLVMGHQERPQLSWPSQFLQPGANPRGRELHPAYPGHLSPAVWAWSQG